MKIKLGTPSRVSEMYEQLNNRGGIGIKRKDTYSLIATMEDSIVEQARRFEEAHGIFPLIRRDDPMSNINKRGIHSFIREHHPEHAARLDDRLNQPSLVALAELLETNMKTDLYALHKSSSNLYVYKTFMEDFKDTSDLLNWCVKHNKYSITGQAIYGQLSDDPLLLKQLSPRMFNLRYLNELFEIDGKQLCTLTLSLQESYMLLLQLLREGSHSSLWADLFRGISQENYDGDFYRLLANVLVVDRKTARQIWFTISEPSSIIGNSVAMDIGQMVHSRCTLSHDGSGFFEIISLFNRKIGINSRNPFSTPVRRRFIALIAGSSLDLWSLILPEISTMCDPLFVSPYEMVVAVKPEEANQLSRFSITLEGDKGSSLPMSLTVK